MQRGCRKAGPKEPSCGAGGWRRGREQRRSCGWGGLTRWRRGQEHGGAEGSGGGAGELALASEAAGLPTVVVVQAEAVQGLGERGRLAGLWALRAGGDPDGCLGGSGGGAAGARYGDRRC